MSKLLRSFTLAGDGSCWRSPGHTTVVKTTLLSLFFVLWGVGAANAQVLCEPSYDCPSDVTVECGTNLNDFSQVGGVIILDEGDCQYSIDIADNTISDDGGCTVVVSRTYTISVIGGVSSWICTQLITVTDTQGPVFTDFQSELFYECASEIPPIGECAATDCNTITENDGFESHTGGDTLNCDLSLTYGPGLDWSLWLSGLTSAGLASNDYYRWVPGTAHMSLYDDGTAHLWGDVVNVSNPSEGWTAHFWMEDGSNWADWSAMGRSFKDDLGLGAPYHTFWTYYELVGGFSHLEGTGDNAGSHLSMTHMPSNYYFGFQCGQGANNRNANMGLSGWFYYTGHVVQDGVSNSISGHGDVTTDKECIPNNPELECSDEFSRFWRAVDQCNNVTIVEQVITVDDNTAPVFDNCPEDMTIQCSDTIPAVAEGLTATDNCVAPEDIVITYMGEVSIQDGCTTIIRRTWTADDQCDNTVDCIQTITVVDTTAPELTVPADATFECDEEVVYAEASATDNCQPNVIITEGESEIVQGECPQEYTIYRYFSADDGCGNVSTGTQTIWVVDTTAPVFDEYPLEVWVECTEVDGVPVPTATDNCDLEVTVTVEVDTASGGCLGILVRYLTATDDCGNSVTGEQYIYIQDTTPANIDEPADQTVQCDSVPEAPGAEGAEIWDNCGYDVEVEFHTEMQEGPCTDSYTILWIWEAWDYCENYSTDTTVITVVDTTNPVIEVSEGGSFSCVDGITFDEPSATDNCDEMVDIVTTMDTIPGNCPQSYTINVHYVATDNCGNWSEAWATYVQYDDEAPMFTSVPEDITIECDQDVPASDATAVDNCGIATVTQSDAPYTTGDCYSVIIRTFTATDECGNWNTATQTITIVDTTAPVITGEPEVEIPCEEFAIDNGIFVTATDNCNEYTIVIDSTELVSGECAGVYIRYYTAYDVCQNVSETFIQIIRLIDLTAPVGVEPEDISVLCSDEIPSFDPMFTDNCGGPVEVVYVGFEVTNVCDSTYTESWTGYDNCGNWTTIDRNVTIYDNVNPWFTTFPADVTVNCDEELPAEVWPTAEDNCDSEVEITVAYDEAPGDCPNERFVYRTYRGVDNCGNQVVETQTISVVDEEAPVFNEDQEYYFTYECNTPIDTIQPIATDNCGDVTYSFTDTLSFESECYSSFYRIWLVTDACGLSSQYWQYIEIIDTTAPVITGLPEVEIPCEEFDMNTGIFVEATDNCNSVTIVIDSTQLVSGECAGVYIRYYTAYDFCENASEQFIQIIRLLDTTAPTVDEEPVDMAYECDEMWYAASPTFTDNCGGEITIIPDLFFETDGCTTTYHYIWTAYDNCNNASTVDQIVTVTDTTDPVASSDPEDFTVECGQLYDIVVPTFTDNCDLELTYDSDVTEEMVGCNTVITFWWSATDDCGNTTTVGNTVTIQDTTAPVLVVPAGGEFSCDEDVVYGEASATDVCDEVVEITYADDTLPGQCPQSYTIVRTWTATDDCLNASTDYSYYYIYDTTAPVFTEVPGTITVECDQEIPATSASAEDNCGMVTITYTDSDLFEDNCAGYIIRTFDAVDECFNHSYAEQIIDIIDTTAPTLILPEDVDAEMPCEQVFYEYLAIYNNGDATEEQMAAVQALFAQLGLLPLGVEDNCDPNAYWEEVEIIITTEGLECPVVAMAECKFQAYDNCGNSSEEGSTFIYIVDNTAPTLTNPVEDEFIECDQDDMGWEPSFDDECNDNITVLPASSITTDGCTTMIHKSWTASDPCGNEITVTHNITITDTTDPVIVTPEPMTYNCYEEFAWADGSVTDNCDEEVDVIIEDDTIPGECPNEYTIVRTWTAIDNCLNTATASSTITVVDNDAPVFTSIPEDITIECNTEIPATMAEAEDLCGLATVTSEDDYYTESACYTEIHRTFVATDECGNWTSAVQNIYIVDTTAPVITGEPQVSVPCEEFDMNTGIFVTATDNCNEYTIVIDSTQQVSGECAGVYMRYYTAWDVCQNVSDQFLQIIFLTDTIAPVGNEPMDITVNCDELIPSFDPEFTDNCAGLVNVVYTGYEITGYCNATYTESWTGTDNCGNSTTIDRNITIVDMVAPVINAQSFETEVECNVIVDYVYPTASDNCDPNVEVNLDYSTTPGECPGEYTETHVWTATDECGNTATVTYVTNHTDTTAPVLSNIPASAEYECDDVWFVVYPTAEDNCSEATVVTEIDTIAGECVNNYTVVYSFYAVDECGNTSETYNTSIFVNDYTAPTFDNEPSNESYECLNWEDYTVQTVTASDNCGPATVSVEVTPEWSDNCGNGLWVVYYTATDLCGHESNIWYTVSVQDTTDPELSSYPENLVLDCQADVPAAEEVSASDNCDNDIMVSYEETCVGDCPEPGTDNSCDLTQPDLGANNCNYNYLGTPAPWSMALFSLPLAYRYYILDESYAGNSFTQNDDGTIHVTSRVVSLAFPDGGFDIDVTFTDMKTWEEWSTQGFPTSFKADCGGEASNHESWLYYLLQAGEGAEVTGWGSFEGSALNVTHAPANNYFGFQYGDGANNLSSGNGLGGWFNYGGVFLYNGQPVVSGGGNISGAGDFAWEFDCCPDYYIVRCWSAMDCSGNEVSWCQTITFEDLDGNIGGGDDLIAEPQFEKDGIISIVSVQPNPATDKSVITFTSELNGNLSLQVMDMTGRVVGDLFNNKVEAGLVYRADFNAISLESGTYMVRLSNGYEQKVERIQIVR